MGQLYAIILYFAVISIKRTKIIITKQLEIAKCRRMLNSPPFIDFGQSEGAARGLG
jgi:hypothetical protein